MSNRRNKIKKELVLLAGDAKQYYKKATDKKISLDDRRWYAYYYYETLMKHQILREELLLPKFKQCSRQNTIDLLEIDKLEEQYALKRYLTFSFYQANLMEALFCSFDTEMVATNSDDYRAGSKITRFFTSLRRIGAESVEGYALFADFATIRDLFVIKVPQKAESDNLFHEYFVGVSSTNKLRRTIPTFSYIFGAFRCLPPVIGEDKKVESWCVAKKNGPLVNYVLFEKVTGPPFSQVVETCNTTEYISYFLQLLFGLRYAWFQVDFTHYDLHHDNVLLREFNTNNLFYIPYPLSDGTLIYILTNRIPTLIDYGRCHVQVDGKHYGFHSRLKGLFANESRPFHDIYKIMMFTVFTALTAKNTSLAYDLLPLVNIWPPESGTGKQPAWGNIQTMEQLETKLVIEYESVFELGPRVLPFEDELKDPYQAVISRIIQAYPNIVNKIMRKEEQLPKNALIFSCNKMKCTTLGKFKRDLIAQ